MRYLKKQGISLSAREYVITALSYMALGLFSSLIIGLIIKTIGEQIGLESFVEMGTFAMDNKVMGGAIGVAIAYGLKAPPLVIFFCIICRSIRRRAWRAGRELCCGFDSDRIWEVVIWSNACRYYCNSVYNDFSWIFYR